MAFKFNIATLLTLIAFTTTATLSASHLNGCTWEFNKTNQIVCNIRTLDVNNPVDLLQDAEGSSRLEIVCESSMYESQLQRNLFKQLTSLNELVLDSCKLLKLSEHSFDGMNSLKKLTISTKNIEWGPQQSLEMQPLTMSGLNKLVNLEITDSNVRVIPDGFYCPLTSLQVLNLTRNRIRSTENIGFSLPTTVECGGSSLQELTALDLSNNELQIIPENWAVSKLRRLQHLYLQHNNISELNSETLAGLNSLKTLNLSYNHLEQLPDGLFYGSRELREIHLQNNELFQLPRSLFHRLEQLLILNLSRNQLTSHHINNGTFAGLIRLIILDLSHNAITRIDTQTFKELYFLQILDLRNNSIGYIDDNAFEPLYNLHTLNLAENRLHTLGDKLFNGLKVLSKLTLNNNLISIIEPKVFNNCSDLKELDLSSNQLQEVPEALKGLTVLKTLDLGENQIAQFRAGAFQNLNQLTGLRLIDNQIENITKGMFESLPHLSVLNLAKNRIQLIERGSFDFNKEIEAIRMDGNFINDINGIFSTLSSLMWLNLAENHLVWFDYAFVPKNLKWLDIHSNYIESLGNYYKLQEEIQIKTLDASHNRLQEIGPMNVPNSIELMFINNNHINKIQPNTFIDKNHLIRVDLYANSLQKLAMHQLRIAPSIASKHQNREAPEFYLGGNPFECDCTMEWIQRVNNFTMKQHPRIMDLQNIECIMPHSRGSLIRPIMQLDVTEFLCNYESHCFALCNCCDYEDCECDMKCPTNCSCFHDQTWNTNMVDCGRQETQRFPSRIPLDATEIYLDGNNYPELDSGLFRQHNKLRHLFLNNSQIEVIRNRTFYGLTSLTTLHLEDNQLQKLYGYEFEQMHRLRELDLHNNKLTFIANETFSHLRSLVSLRIDGNQLVNVQLWQMLPSSIFKGNSQMQAMTLGRNPWTCRCQFLQEMTQFVADNAVIVQDSQDIYCVEDSKKREIDFNSSSACSDYYADSSSGLPNLILTNGYIPLMITLLATICLLVLFAILFVFREPLRLWLFAHYGVRVFGPPCEDSDKLYDAVFLHSAKDTEYIIKHIATELENGNGRPPMFRLCLQHRDLAEDASYIQLLETICASRKIVILLTRNFLQTEWSRYDVKRAIHESLRGRPQKLVIIEDPDVLLDAESDIELLPYMKTSAVKRIRRTDRQFWGKLRDALPVEPLFRGNNYTLDHQRALPHYQSHTMPHHMVMHHERFKHANGNGTMNGGMMFHHHRQAPPPAYISSAPEMDDTNYSSATTATPSPRPSRRGEPLQHHHHQMHLMPNPVAMSPQQHQNIHRAPSEHIYSSIDSDYGGFDPQHQLLPHPIHQQQSSVSSTASVHRPVPTWRNSNFIVDNSTANPQSPSYLV
ncbi:CLUMA_CG005612, isoform A [Clunio marinus]|uniref:CLUMA_CG005612, isoform A n=1 Tax=Clunio marinus TaxID=568069 RepID=A0A1J1HVD5_9DIPT|nr:CLUMA_CG005612, isoform A [Clunio marinus]